MLGRAAARYIAPRLAAEVAISRFVADPWEARSRSSRTRSLTHRWAPTTEPWCSSRSAWRPRRTPPPRFERGRDRVSPRRAGDWWWPVGVPSTASSNGWHGSLGSSARSRIEGFVDDLHAEMAAGRRVARHRASRALRTDRRGGDGLRTARGGRRRRIAPRDRRPGDPRSPVPGGRCRRGRRDLARRRARRGTSSSHRSGAAGVPAGGARASRTTSRVCEGSTKRRSVPRAASDARRARLTTSPRHWIAATCAGSAPSGSRRRAAGTPCWGRRWTRPTLILSGHRGSDHSRPTLASRA